MQSYSESNTKNMELEMRLHSELLFFGLFFANFCVQVQSDLKPNFITGAGAKIQVK